jgi:hypothetical protein
LRKLPIQPVANLRAEAGNKTGPNKACANENIRNHPTALRLRFASATKSVTGSGAPSTRNA